MQEDVKWYALKVFNNRVFEAEGWLKKDGIECFLPTHEKRVERDGRQRVLKRPLLGSLLFVRTTEKSLRDFYQMHWHLLFVYRDTVTGGFAVIPDHEFRIFRMALSVDCPDLEFFNDEKKLLNLGDRVRVTGGPLQGLEGYIKRINHNRRLLVVVRGVVAVATSYIPQCFLEKIEEPDASFQ